MITTEYYEDVNVDGVRIKSRRGFKGNEEDGVLDVFEIIGSKNGIYKGESGNWQTGAYYNPNKFTYKEAMKHWQNINLHKFAGVTN